MADRTSAKLMGRVFQLLAMRLLIWDANVHRVIIDLAKNIYNNEVIEGDFSPYQMEADEFLAPLGLARPKTLEECERDLVEGGYVYFHEKGF